MSSQTPTKWARTLEKRITVRRALITAWLLFSAFFVAGRVGSYGPNHGDVAIWIPMHEWLARGATLYDTVWDHKDWGFFWLPHPLYILWGINGLYVAGFLAVVALSAGTYLIVRSFMTAGGALSVAAAAAVLYSSSPSFWSVFTENLSIGLVILAFGLLVRHPLFGGLAWAVAASIKVAGVGLFALVILAASFLVLRGRSYSGNFWTPRWVGRALTGFLLGSILIVLLAAATGSLSGWIDVLSYNREYASQRGFPPNAPILEAPFAFLAGAVSDFSRLGEHQVWFLMALSLTIVSLSILIIGQRAIQKLGAPSNPSPRHLVFLTLMLVLGSLLVTLAQRPSPQHWQFFVGPAALLASVLYSLLYSARLKYPRVIRSVGLGLLFLPLIVGIFFDRTMLPRGILDRGIALTYFAQGGIFGDELAMVPPGSSFASFSINDERISVRQLPPDSSLQCPFIVQFPWYFPRYSQEIESCIEATPDIVIVGLEPWGNEMVRNELATKIRREYTLCLRSVSTHQLWVRSEIGCDVLEPTSS